MSDERNRFRFGVRGALVWLAAIAIALVATDLAERFAFYQIKPSDRRSLPRMVRRPIKDAGLTLLHGLWPKDVARPDVPVFDFYFKPDDADRLVAAMTRVRVLGTHDTQTRAWVPARMRVDGQTFDVKVKLRGRQHYHVVPPRPSLRVKIRHGRSYRGADVFNLIDPFDKTTDQVFLWEAEDRGLIGWDATMGILSIGGDPVATVQYVEQIRRPTGDRTGRPEGMFFRGTGERYTEGADPERCGKRVTRVAEWLSDTSTTVPYSALAETLDMERFRWFTALTEFSGDSHGFLNFNMKAYCDPVTTKVEFVIWDTRFGVWRELPKSDYPEEGTQFLRNDRYRFFHDQALYTLARDRVEPMLERMREFQASYGDLLEGDPFFWFPRGGPDGGFMAGRAAKLERTLRGNARDVRDALEGDRLDWFVDARAGELLLRTVDRGAKRVTALVTRGPNGEEERPLPEPVVVFGRYRDRQPVVPLPLPQGIAPQSISDVVAHNVHTAAPVSATRLGREPEGVRVEVAWDGDAPRELPALPAGFTVDRAARQIRVGPGAVRISEHVLLPAGWSLRVAPGTHLWAGPGALLEVRGDLFMRGRPDAPIRVSSLQEETWGSIAVLGDRLSPARVEIAHTTLTGGRGSNAGSAVYTGSLSIYNADVRLDHLTVQGGRADDAINLKYATFEATDCHYRDGVGDAVDYDFAHGTDLRTVIERFGDDGIDISGSKVRIELARIGDVGDKALSIGEASSPHVVDVQVSDANVGCAVKDRSEARIEGLTVVRSNSAVSLYQKKPSFGPSQARFTELVAVEVGGLAVVDAGSELDFVDTVRVGGPTPSMRPFPGVENVVQEGLARLSSRRLLQLARHVRERQQLALGQRRPARPRAGGSEGAAASAPAG